MTGDRYDVRVLRGVRIPLRDGATLAADLLLPVVDQPVPALVTLMAYRRDALGGAGCWRSLEFFARNGYAALLVELRGVGSSDGPAQPPCDPSEGVDGADVVAWAARQPWCSGAVGAWGFSYGAELALRTATERPAALRAVVSLMGFTDPERDFVHPAGAAGALGPLGVWGVGTLVNQLLPPLLDFADPAEQRRWHERVDSAEPYLLDLYRHPPRHPVWRERAVDVTGLTVPTLCVGGWRDAFCAATPRLYESLAGPRALVMGPWLHSMPQDAADAPIDLHALALRWWDRWLRGVPNGAESEPPVTVYVQGDAPHWRALPAWPPTGSATLAADRDRQLVPQPLVETETLGDRDIGVGAGPDPTAGTRSGLWGIPNGGYGQPLDQHDDDLRGAAFTSAPFAYGLLLLGRPAVQLTAGLGRLVLKLTDVDPAGRSVLVCGAVAAPGPATRRVELDPVAYRLAPGHRLRIVVSDSAFPRLWPALPGGLTVDALTLDLPVPAELPSPAELGDGAGEVVTVAAPPADPAPPWAADLPHWELHRDLLPEQVTVLVGDELHCTLPATGQRFDQHTELRAEVAAAEPGGAAIHGVSTVSARTTTGEQVRLRVEVRLRADTATATGEVEINGVCVVRREWRALLAEQPDDSGGHEQRERGEDEQGVVPGDEPDRAASRVGAGANGGHRAEYQQPEAAAELAAGLVRGGGQGLSTGDSRGEAGDRYRLESEAQRHPAE